MRITTKMMNNNIMNNINKNKLNMNKLDEQYTSGKKIQRPSDDPIVAIRTLKLRATISEAKQYLDKNIPDAQSWMELTDSTLGSMNDILTSLYEKFTYGATDTLSASNRDAICETMQQLSEQIYDEGNTNYAGRYIFTGYKTDSSLTFSSNQDTLKYQITEKFNPSDIENISRVIGGYNYSDYDEATSTVDSFSKAPEVDNSLYRLRLSYDDLDLTNFSQDDFKVIDQTSGTEKTFEELGIKVESRNSKDTDAFNIGNDEAVYMVDTGEIIFGKDAYLNFNSNSNSTISITYDKNEFNKGEVKPEHYFDCTVTDEFGNVSNFEYKKQDIDYEVSFSQSMKVNTQIDDILSNDLKRTIDETLKSVTAVSETEYQISEVNKKLSDATISPDQQEALKKLKSQLELELALRTDQMTQNFEKGIESISGYQSDMNVAVANLGSRLSRLELIEDRMETQLEDYTELLADNESVDMVETYVNLTSAETVYNASLSMAAKVSKQSLLDYL